MNNVKIFRANRGEGKSKWLVERIKECADAGRNCYYIGWVMSFNQVRRLYEATYYEVCPLKHGEPYKDTNNNCFFTDEFFGNLLPVQTHQLEVLGSGDPWYITMSKEDFVN